MPLTAFTVTRPNARCNALDAAFAHTTLVELDHAAVPQLTSRVTIMLAVSSFEPKLSPLTVTDDIPEFTRLSCGALSVTTGAAHSNCPQLCILRGCVCTMMAYQFRCMHMHAWRKEDKPSNVNTELAVTDCTLSHSSRFAPPTAADGLMVWQSMVVEVVQAVLVQRAPEP